MIIQLQSTSIITYGQENWIFLSQIRTIQLTSSKKSLVVRITWTNGDTDVIEGEDALSIAKDMVRLKTQHSTI